MSNMPNVRKRQFCVRIPLRIARKIDKLAMRENRPGTQIVVELLDFGTQEIQLDGADMAAIRAEEQRNLNRRRAQ